jgi:pimeloyl-ACP methyl ester carboxylesterase
MNRRRLRLTVALLIIGATVLWQHRASLMPRLPPPVARSHGSTAKPAQGAAALPVPSTLQRGTVTLQACDLHAEQTPIPPVAAFCTTVEVLEDRDLPQGRRIGLRVAVIPALAERPAADAVTFLDGGPGGAATADYPLVAPGFAGLHKTRDILLIDQRGTGASNPLSCPRFPTTPVTQRVHACAAAVGDRADTRRYTTVDATADLDEVRRRLGYPQLTVIGVSYGTRVAQVYARDYPQAVRAIVLDSPVPNSLVLGSEHARNLESVLKGRFDSCRQAADCSRRFGDPYATLEVLAERLAEKPVDVTITDPLTQAPRAEHLDRAGLAVLTRLYAYNPLTLALLPLTLDEAKAGRYGPLLGQLLLVQSDLSTRLEGGMELSVLCSEDADLLTADPEDAKTLLGTEFVTGAKRACADWPHAPMPPHFHDPLTGRVPTLLLSGEFDPVTPPRYAKDIASHLQNARTFVLPGQGHAVMSTGCAPLVVEHFVDHADFSALDADCLQRERAAPFFLGYTGSAP